MPVPYGDNNFRSLNHVEFGRQLERATDGGITIKVHSSGSLFKNVEIKNATRSGQAPIGEFLLSRLSNENPVSGMDSVPFLANSYANAKKLWNIQRPAVEKTGDLSGMKFRASNAAT
ncbi:MAG: hypothetical protein GKR97_02565 [Rhizobiaceae bacterium]|nr:hypothetical protein [Rhizobiaceae bacterium]